MNLETLIKLAIEGELRLHHIDSHIGGNEVSRTEMFNSLAIRVAREFQQNKLGFEDADHAANLIWSAMVQDSLEHAEGYKFAQPAYDIYEAFDAGEYGHKTGINPIEINTRPRINEILKNA
ncbi:MAG: hypothetical protein V7721_10525 [Porticoccaceae bacterium]